MNILYLYKIDRGINITNKINFHRRKNRDNRSDFVQNSTFSTGSLRV